MPQRHPLFACHLKYRSIEKVRLAINSPSRGLEERAAEGAGAALGKVGGNVGTGGAGSLSMLGGL